jgi:hydroxyethylthiazole kinase-like uncharacterized protein yjeF
VTGAVDGRPILTAAQMRAAEAAAVAAGTSERLLMRRAGMAAAEAVRGFAGRLPVLVLCGPGNNGGDGYVIANRLTELGVPVRIAASGEPTTETAGDARRGWEGPVEALAEAGAASVLVDALFGTGLTRPLDAQTAADLARLAEAARVRVAVDIPSGAATDDGALLSPVADFDVTITFAALKPSHLLQPAARHMGRIVVADIGVVADSQLHALARPHLPPPGPDDHKYSRGYVAVLGGEMPGAAALAASAAARAGAGYVRLLGAQPVAGLPHAIVQSGVEHLADARIAALVVGPGLGRTEAARALLEQALSSPHPLVLDADALFLLDAKASFAHVPILTPHAGEFARLFGALPGSKVEQTRAAAAAIGAVIVYKGADTVMAAPDGRAVIGGDAPSWLASAGTGDVLAGTIATMRACGLEPFEAACAGVWLHGEAARLAGPGLIADDLLTHLPAALGECR